MQVVTAHLIQFVIHKLDMNGMIAWAVDLERYDIRYMLKAAMKLQILAYFIAEFEDLEQEKQKEQTPIEVWSLYIVGSSNKK